MLDASQLLSFQHCAGRALCGVCLPCSSPSVFKMSVPADQLCGHHAPGTHQTAAVTGIMVYLPVQSKRRYASVPFYFIYYFIADARIGSALEPFCALPTQRVVSLSNSNDYLDPCSWSPDHLHFVPKKVPNHCCWLSQAGGPISLRPILAEVWLDFQSHCPGSPRQKLSMQSC